MAKNVIIHIPTIGEDYVQWAVADDRGALVSDIYAGTVSEAASAVEGRRATLVLPGDDVLLAEAIVPGASAARAAQAIPFQLEEMLADDVESLHFAVGSKGKEDNYPVAVVGRDAMDMVREQCGEAGLRPTEIVPEILALPKFDSEDMNQTTWTALADEHKAVIRLNGYKGFATDYAMAGMMLDGAQQDLPDETSAAMVVYNTNDRVSMPALNNVQIENRHCDSRLALYASGLANAPRINLLQGDYSPKTQFDKNWKPWRWTAALAAILGIALFAGKWMEYRRLDNQIVQLDTQMEGVFNEAMPGSRMVRPLSQMQNEIKKRSGGSTGGFNSQLSQIAASVATQPATTIRSINFREGRFDLDLNTDAIPTLDLLKSELAKRGELTMTIQSTNQDRDGLRGRVRIE